MKTMLLTLIALISLSLQAAPVLSTFEMDVYRFGVSKNTDCSNMQIVINNGVIPKRVDLINSPNFGSAYIEPGTYPCVALEVGRRIYMTPLASPAGIGSCTMGVKASTFIGMDVDDATLTTYMAGLSNTDNNMFRNNTDSVFIDKQALVNLSDILLANTERMTLFLSTGSIGPSSPGYECQFMPPFLTGANCGIPVAQPLVVTANTAGKFITRIVDPATALDNTVAGACNITDIEFDFQ